MVKDASLGVRSPEFKLCMVLVKVAKFSNSLFSYLQNDCMLAHLSKCKCTYTSLAGFVRISAMKMEKS